MMLSPLFQRPDCHKESKNELDLCVSILRFYASGFPGMTHCRSRHGKKDNELSNNRKKTMNTIVFDCRVTVADEYTTK